MNEPLLDETKEAEALARMNAVVVKLKDIADKLGGVIKNFIPNNEGTKKEVKEILDMFKKLNNEYNLKDYWRVLKSFSDEQLDEVKEGVSKLFSENGGSITVNSENNTVTISSPNITKNISSSDLPLETCINPMHLNRNGGSRRQKQYGGVFDPISIFALGFTGATGVAIGTVITILLSFIYLGICLLLYSGSFNNMGPIAFGYWISFGPACIPVALLLFLNKIRKMIQNSCSSNSGGKLKTARKRILIKKKRKTIAKKSKKSRR